MKIGCREGGNLIPSSRKLENLLYFDLVFFVSLFLSLLPMTAEVKSLSEGQAEFSDLNKKRKRRRRRRRIPQAISPSSWPHAVKSSSPLPVREEEEEDSAIFRNVNSPPPFLSGGGVLEFFQKSGSEHRGQRTNVFLFSLLLFFPIYVSCHYMSATSKYCTKETWASADVSWNRIDLLPSSPPAAWMSLPLASSNSSVSPSPPSLPLYSCMAIFRAECSSRRRERETEKKIITVFPRIKEAGGPRWSQTSSCSSPGRAATPTPTPQTIEKSPGIKRLPLVAGTVKNTFNKVKNFQHVKKKLTFFSLSLYLPFSHCLNYGWPC